MITGEAPNFFDVAPFITGLQRVARGVARVSVQSITPDPDYYLTGWLITDTLVVTTSYSMRGIVISPKNSHITCLFTSDNGETFEIGAYYLSDLPPRASDSSLLRLCESLPDRALRLEGERIRQGKPLFIVQYPQGNPQLQFSIGQLLSYEGSWLRYNADTLPGSGGSPILSSNWYVAGMHHASKSDTKPVQNEGFSIAKILEGLRGSSAWGEIARYHNLANITAVRWPLERSKKVSAPIHPEVVLLEAAVRWSFDPKKYTSKERKQIKLLVSDPLARRWSLRASERQKLLRSADSLNTLRKARGDEVIDDPGQRVIDRILKGPPYHLTDVEESDLPYWLQATRWFAEVAPSLPTPGEVNRTLENRRVRSRFLSIAGADFRGRVHELSQLQKWYEGDRVGPIVITGIGGVGKSALVARFATSLPEDPLLLWLDFDRADLAPDDAISVLTLLYQQAKVQVEGIQLPTLEASAWKKNAEGFGESLAQILTAAPKPLLVLDGFEVAQYVKQHQEIWRLLELILKRMPTLRVVVSGRAPVKNLKLNRRPARQLNLTGMTRQDAKAWLREHGIKKESVLKRVLDIAHGIPLVLKLAVRWVETGGEVDELPEQLPNELVQGFLYQRILDRVIDPALKPLVQDALVLRYLTAEMLPQVLGDSIPKELDVQEVFSRLQLEMGIVGRGDANPTPLSITLSERTGVLNLRPEVRTATLKLLEKADAARVRKIDEKATQWYAGQDPNDIANIAELVYHHLRLGNVEAAESVWRDECAPLLMHAEDDLPVSPPAVRLWLQKHGVGTVSSNATLENWEKVAERRIRSAISRGLVRAVPEILAERRERSAASPLILYDAWTQWTTNHLDHARSILDEAKPMDGVIGRDRAILGAMLAEQSGERRAAYQLLDHAQDEALWMHRSDGRRERLAITAAQVHLTVDLEAEIKLLGILDKDPTLNTILQQFLAPMDVVLPNLRQRVEPEMPFEIMLSPSPSEVPLISTDLDLFANQLNSVRRVSSVLPLDLKVLINNQEPWDVNDLLDLQPKVSRFLKEPNSDAGRLGMTLAILGWHRWRIATTSLFLAQACDLVNTYEKGLDSLSLSIIGTIAAFNGQHLRIFDNSRKIYSELNEFLHPILFKRNVVSMPILSPGRISIAKKILFYEKKELPEEWIKKWLAETPKDNNLASNTELREFFPKYFFDDPNCTDLLAVLLFHVGPNPLEVLCRRIVGLPDSLNL